MHRIELKLKSTESFLTNQIDLLLSSQQRVHWDSMHSHGSSIKERIENPSSFEDRVSTF